MTLKQAALCTTSLVTLALALQGIDLTDTAHAAEVKPLGALDIYVGGKVKFYSFFGDIKDKTGGDQNAGTYDFRTDNEVYIYARGKDESTGLEYGGNIELEADTNNSADADETYIFLRGKFGDIRFGDQHGIVKKMAVGIQQVAVFTGGFDQEHQGRPFDAATLIYGFQSEDATKVAYFSPTFGGFQFGVSLTPSTDSDGNDIKTTQGSTNIQDLVEPGIAFKRSFGDFGVLASVTGGIGRFASDDGESRDFRQINSGLNVTYANFTIGGGYGAVKGTRPFSVAAGDTGTANSGESYIGAWVLDPGSKQQYFNLGAKAVFGPATVSLIYGQTLASHVAGGTPDGSDPEPHYGIAGVELGVAPGLTVGGEVGYFNNSDNTENNDGIIGVAGLKLTF